MGRQVDAAPVRQDDEEARWEFQQLRRLLRASEPGSKAEAVSGLIMAEAVTIERRELPPGEAVAELRAFIASLGLAEAADRHVGALRRAREWARSAA